MSTLVPPAPAPGLPAHSQGSMPPTPRRHVRATVLVVLGVVVAVIAVVVAVALVVGRGSDVGPAAAPAGPVEVVGTVTDARTGEPVEDALVTADDLSVTTGDDGGFAITADPDVVLVVEADRYEPGEVAVAEAVDVALQPVSVSGTVTSRMTGAGLTASLVLAEEEVATTAADGTFTAYGVLAGDTLTVAAAGYITATVELTDGPTDVTLIPEEVTVRDQVNQWVAAGDFAALSAWVFRDDLGLVLVPMSPGYEWTPADTIAEFPDVFAYGDAREVLGTFDLLQLYVVKPGGQNEAVYGWTEEEEPSWITLGDQIVITGAAWDDPETSVVIWFRDPMMVVVHASTAEEAGRVLGAVMAG